ncbi:MAG: hypothetical protein ACI4A5_03295 [Hominilimicola sp.]
MSVPNQKKIKINKEICDSTNLYATINLDALNAAMKDLTKIGTFKLWMYLSKNQDGYEFDLSCVDCGTWGIKKDAYHNAVNELIDKGYLIKDNQNRYIFREKKVVYENAV